MGGSHINKRHAAQHRAKIRTLCVAMEGVRRYSHIVTIHRSRYRAGIIMASAATAATIVSSRAQDAAAPLPHEAAPKRANVEEARPATNARM